jgi:hypothetical protein
VTGAAFNGEAKEFFSFKVYEVVPAHPSLEKSIIYSCQDIVTFDGRNIFKVHVKKISPIMPFTKIYIQLYLKDESVDNIF